MPKAVWVGSLAFGLVTIPVRLYPATEPRDVRFHLMDAHGRRVRYRRFVELAEAGSPSSETSHRIDDVEEEIAYEELMRGAERDDGSVVILADDAVRSIQREWSV